MNKIKIKDNDSTLSSLIEEVNQSQEATMITNNQNQKGVLLSLEQWNSIQETLYLMSIPGVKEDLIEGKNTNWEDCTPVEQLEW